jgi:hypothetical protein
VQAARRQRPRLLDRVDEGYPGWDAGARLTGAMAAMGDPAPPPGSGAFVGRDREVAELVAALTTRSGAGDGCS